MSLNIAVSVNYILDYFADGTFFTFS